MRGTVIGDGDLSDLVDDHLVQTLRSERGADDIGDRHGCPDYIREEVPLPERTSLPD
jgi:hypothetical protein